MFTFHDLSNILRTWAASAPELQTLLQRVGEPKHSEEARLLQCLRRLADKSHPVQAGDLAGLLRQVLRRCSEENPHAPAATLEVPRGGNWPDDAVWKEFSVNTLRLDAPARYRIEALPWQPAWLDGDIEGPALIKESRVEPAREIPADPTVAADLGYKTYRSQAQAMAVRATNLLQAGDTLLVCLPTGGGKSTLFQSLAMSAAECKKGDVVLIVVPTTALALDQERRMRDYLKRTRSPQASFPLAYHAGLEEATKREFRNRLRNGQQSFVITSPESALRGLQPLLQDQARKGRLAWLCVDEAHHIGQWGENFRPKFQQLAAAVATWRHDAPPDQQVRTLLLSATIPQDALNTIRTLFSPIREGSARGEDSFHVLLSPQLRAEPDFWVSEAGDDEERVGRVLEAIRHLPRPMIVYTTLRKDAEDLHRHLLNLGSGSFSRVGLARGGDVNNDLLRSWNGRKIDVMVANSAFGLGMDNPDVRTVVHACIPETVDRYYQEVGRGGRDGKASVALWLTTGRDFEDMKTIGRDQSIGLEKAFERWSWMHKVAEASARDLGDDEFQVSLDAVPPRLNDENEANRNWNLRTLLLMANAGVVSLRVPHYPQIDQDDEEDDDAFRLRRQREWAAWQSKIIVRTLTNMRDQNRFDERVGITRKRRIERNERAQQKMWELHSKQYAFGEVFSEAYSLVAEPLIRDRELVPTPLNGRCPKTRPGGTAGAVHGSEPEIRISPSLLCHLRFDPEDRLGHAQQEGSLYVFYPGEVPTKRRRRRRKRFFRGIFDFVEKGVRVGIAEVALTDEWREENEERIQSIATNANPRFLIVRSLDEEDPVQLTEARLSVPRISILPPGTSARDFQRIRGLDRPSHIILISESQPDPERTDSDFCDRHAGLPLKHAHQLLSHGETV